MKRTALTAAAILMAMSATAYAQSSSSVPGYPDVKVVPVDTTTPKTAPAADGAV